MIDDDVTAFFAIGGKNFFEGVAEVLFVVVDDVIGAESFGLGDFLVASNRRDDDRAEEFRDLDGGDRDAASTGLDQYDFSRL